MKGDGGEQALSFESRSVRRDAGKSLSDQHLWHGFMPASSAEKKWPALMRLYRPLSRAPTIFETSAFLF